MADKLESFQANMRNKKILYRELERDILCERADLLEFLGECRAQK